MKEECIGLKNTKRSFWYKNNYLNQLYNYRRVTFYLWLPLKNSHKNCLIIKVWYRRNIKSWFVIHSAQKKKKGTGSNVQRMFSSEKKTSNAIPQKSWDIRYSSLYVKECIMITQDHAVSKKNQRNSVQSPDYFARSEQISHLF